MVLHQALLSDNCNMLHNFCETARKAVSHGRNIRGKNIREHQELYSWTANTGRKCNFEDKTWNIQKYYFLFTWAQPPEVVVDHQISSLKLAPQGHCLHVRVKMSLLHLTKFFFISYLFYFIQIMVVCWSSRKKILDAKTYNNKK